MSGTLFDRYREAEYFTRPTVIRDGYRHPVSGNERRRWLVLGPGHRWMGCDFGRWERAVQHALEGCDK